MSSDEALADYFRALDELDSQSDDERARSFGKLDRAEEARTALIEALKPYGEKS